METATVSSKYQIVIPKKVRDAIDLRPGERLGFVVQGRSLHIVPVGDLTLLRGIFAGADQSGIRDRSDLPE